MNMVNHGVNGYRLDLDDSRIMASLDIGVFNQLIAENLQDQKAKNPGASVVHVDEDELASAVESRLRHLCDVPDSAKLIEVIHQRTMVFQ